MSVKIRLTRMGKKKQPSYRVVVMDSRKPRDGKYIEQIGRYDPRQDPSLIEIDNERALDWLSKGAQPTERAQKLLEVSGAWTQFRVARGDILTIDDTPETPAPVVLDEVAEEPAPVMLDDLDAEEPAPVMLDDLDAEPEPVSLDEIQAETEPAATDETDVEGARTAGGTEDE
ncbi:MAG: 30S ribosomal protein S16, partial [Actinomycetota bacterium]|nr:30S ribosomal protein S16 [Actinomycetota bacterium]